MKNNFALSFGLSLIVIGQISFFLKTSDVVMLGVALSACCFSLVSLLLCLSKRKKHEIVYTIPFLILLLFCCFGDDLKDVDYVREAINSGFINSITFYSFGLIFISEYINKKNEVILEKNKYISVVDENLEYAESIIDMIDDYHKSLEKKKIVIDSESQDLINRIYELLGAKIQQCSINNKLLIENKDEFNLDDVNAAFVKSTIILKEKHEKNELENVKSGKKVN